MQEKKDQMISLKISPYFYSGEDPYEYVPGLNLLGRNSDLSIDKSNSILVESFHYNLKKANILRQDSIISFNLNSLNIKTKVYE